MKIVIMSAVDQITFVINLSFWVYSGPHFSIIVHRDYDEIHTGTFQRDEREVCPPVIFNFKLKWLICFFFIEITLLLEVWLAVYLQFTVLLTYPNYRCYKWLILDRDRKTE